MEDVSLQRKDDPWLLPGLYVLVGKEPVGRSWRRYGNVHAFGHGPLFSQASRNGTTLLFEGVLTHGRREDLSDAETALAVYEDAGVPGLRGLEGFFQLALIEEKSNRVVVVSDPLATRPLYFYDSQEVVACSPTPLLFVSESLPMSLDRQGMYQMFRLCHGVGGRTMVREVVRSQALATYIIDARGQLTEQRPTSLAKEPDFGLTLDEAASRMQTLHSDVVSRVLDHPLLKTVKLLL